MSNLHQKVVVITGASSGIGRAIARAASAKGARVALIARGREGLEATAAELEREGGQTLVLPLDVAEAGAVSAAADQVVAKWGGIDVWVNNAIVTVYAPISRMTPEEYRRVTEVDYLGTVHGTLAALRHMRKRDAGSIVQIGSALAYRSIPLQSAYCASKAAVRGFTDSLRSELWHERSHINVSMLQLPGVNTPQFEVARNKLGQHPHPVPPIYQPEVVAGAVLYAVEHHSAELWVGWSTIKAVIGQFFMPRTLDRYVGDLAWREQVTSLLPPATTDNLEAPLPGDRGVHGVFDHEAKRFSAQIWARTHPAAAGVGVALVLVGALAAARKLAEALAPARELR